MTVNFLAVLAAAVAGFIVGAIWYTGFGGPWKTALGLAPVAATGGTRPPVPALITSAIALVIMAAMLSGLMAHMGGASLRTGLITGALVWLGFVVTVIGTINAYQQRRIVLTVIDAGHWLAVLLVQGAVLGLMG